MRIHRFIRLLKHYFIYLATFVIISYYLYVYTETKRENRGNGQTGEYVFPSHDIDDDIYIQLRDGKADPFPTSGKFPTQLKKLEKYHGAIVEKRSIEYYKEVKYPNFVDEHDPQGMGEGGRGSRLRRYDLDEEEARKRRELYKRNYFDEYVSQRISVRRSLNDCSSQECKRRREDYPKDLPPVDVIIIFHNEAWSTLLRTVHSVLLRTPEHLLGEIIIVDDNSTAEYLGAPLEKYFSQEPKVKIIRALVRGGLTKARLLGYYASTAPVMVFLDSHVECFPGWLEPLLTPIKSDFRTVTYPNVEQIRPVKFSVGCTNSLTRLGTFRVTTLVFKLEEITQEDLDKRRKQPKTFSDNIRSPAMPGGLFAISRKFFEMVGKYDPELEHWGAENVELSLKTWMCHGTLLLVPCSHIGHIHRSKNPIKSYVNIGNKNSVRVAEVWMDDYKNYFYEHNNYDISDPGDLSERKAIRKRLKCHDFAWYHHNIFPNLTREVPTHSGEIRLTDTSLCMDSMGGHVSAQLYYCHSQGGSQFWVLDTLHEIRSSGRFLCGIQDKVITDRTCVSGPGQWKYLKTEKVLQNLPSGQCLSGNPDDKTISLKDCDITDKRQHWNFRERSKDHHFPI